MEKTNQKQKAEQTTGSYTGEQLPAEKKQTRVGRKKEAKGIDPRLADFTSRELMRELKFRGYTGKLSFTQEININRL